MLNKDEKIKYDVLIIGGGPSGFSFAHNLVDICLKNKTKVSIAILEKSKEFGGHIVSGAVSNLRVVKKLFPDYEKNDFPLEGICNKSYFSILGQEKKWNVPNFLLPKGLIKEGCAILTLSHVVVWMYNKLKEKIKDQNDILIDFYPGFSAHKVIFDGDKVVGVSVKENNSNDLNNEIYADVTVFGDKGFISRDVIDKFSLRKNPQIWSVGVKEVWQLPEGKSIEGKVWHSMGFPLLDGTFGGGFIYGMKGRKVTIGMVISLDSQNPNINPQQQLQEFKKHPWIQALLKDGTLIKYGAAVLPEGGYYSLPEKFAVDGGLLLGDALGVLDIERLSGIDKSMESGYQASNVVYEALLKNDYSENALSSYKDSLMKSFVGKELYQGRYFRYAWQENPRLINDYLPIILKAIDKSNAFFGFLKIGFSNKVFRAIFDAVKLKYLMDGNEAGKIKYKYDHEHIVPNFNLVMGSKSENYDKSTIYAREDAVFYSKTKYHEGNLHIDEFNANTCIECIKVYDKLQKQTPCVSDCTAEVHRVDLSGGTRVHGMSLENCIQCRTCEIVCPEVNLRVKPTSEGSGPDFMGL